MGESLPMFVPSFNRSLHIEARPDRLSADGGALLVRELLEQSGIIDHLTAKITDPRAQDQIDYTLAELLRTVVVMYGQGWRDQDDADALRLDPALRLAIADATGTITISDGHHLASQPTLSRLLTLLAEPANRRVLQTAIAEMAARRVRAMNRGHRLREVTLDVDGLPIEVHGNQPQAAYNGHYHQQMYHPIVASIAETGDMLDARLRAGNAHTAEGALNFILDLVARVEGTLCRVALVRIDAGFPEEKLLAGLEANRTPYVARIKNNKVLDRLAAPHLARPVGRPPAEPRMWFHEKTYAAGAWSRERRVVLVVLERPGELLLDHFWLLTNITVEMLSGEDLLALYRERGKAEGHMGELMDVLKPALSSSSRARWPETTDAFARNEALLLLHLLSYEVLHSGRCVMEKITRTGWSLRRFRERVLKVGARVVLHARRATLVISETAAPYWRQFFQGLGGLAWDTA
jgi:DDE family transposase